MTDHSKANNTFDSASDKRIESNTFPDTIDPDDVSYNYRLLNEMEKNNMREVKLLAQALINKIRTCGSGPYIEEAVKSANLASIWATKCITGDR